MGSLENLVVKIQGLSSSAADISHLHGILKQADDYLQSQSPRNLAPSLANLDPSVHSLGYLFILTVVPDAVIYGYSGLFKGFGCIALDSDPLDDSIVKQIEVSSDQELKESRDLIKRFGEEICTSSAMSYCSQGQAGGLQECHLPRCHLFPEQFRVMKHMILEQSERDHGCVVASYWTNKKVEVAVAAMANQSVIFSFCDDVGFI